MLSASKQFNMVSQRSMRPQDRDIVIPIEICCSSKRLGYAQSADDSCPHCGGLLTCLMSQKYAITQRSHSCSNDFWCIAISGNVVIALGVVGVGCGPRNDVGANATPERSSC